MTDSSQIKYLYEKFQEYLDLSYVKARSDPEEEPYKTKYAARKLIESELNNLDKNLVTEKHVTNDDSNDNDFNQKTIELKHLTETYIHFLDKLNQKCLDKYSMTSKSFLIRKLFEYNLARNYIETEEVESGERILAKIVQELESISNNSDDNNLEQESNENSDIKKYEAIYNPLIYNLKLSCFIELVYVWSFRSDYKKCLQLLESIDEVYRVYKDGSLKNYLDTDNSFSSNEKDLVTMPFDPIELICLNNDLSVSARRASFEALYTHTLFYSAQVYGKLDEKEKSAYYCQLTLQRQVDEHTESIENESEFIKDNDKYFYQQPQERVTFNPLDWATHAAALSQFYVCENDFPTARHCLCSSEAILNKLNQEKSQQSSEASERLVEQTQSIRRCWGKYAIELLKKSKYKLREAADLPSESTLLAELDKPSKFHFNLPSKLYDLKKVELDAITSNMPLDYEQARKIFLKAQKILNDAKECFKLDGYVTDHCEIVRDISELYAGLLFFEEDLERRCKMQKRRLDSLIPVCDEINSQFYLTIKRQLLFDIGTIYSELLDSKIDIFKAKKEKNQLNLTESASSIKKINQLATSSIERFEEFLETMKIQPKREILPDKFDDHNVRPALLAKFYIGRLHSKMITTEPAKRLENVKQAFENYKYLVDYYERNENQHTEEVLDSIRAEYNACKEMITFLPVEMDKLRYLI